MEDRLTLGETEASPPVSSGLRRSAVLFASGAILGKAVGLVLLPVLTRSLSQSEYGRADVLLTLGSSVISMLTLGADVAVVRLAAQNVASARTLLASYLGLASGVGIASGLILMVVSESVARLLFGNSSFGSEVQLVGIVVAVGSVQVGLLNIFRATSRPIPYSLLSGGSLAMYGAFVVVAARLHVLSVTVVVGSWMLGLATSVAIGSVLVAPVIRARPSLAGARALLSFGLPVAPIIIFAFASDFLTRGVLVSSRGQDAVANLAVAIRFASIASLATTAIQLAWQPFAYRVTGAAIGREQLARTSTRIIALVVAICAALSSVGPFAVSAVAGPSYVGAAPVAQVLLIGPLLAVVYMLASTSLLYVGDRASLTFAAGLGFVATLGLNLILAPRYGALGTATAMDLGLGLTLAVGLIRARAHLTLQPAPTGVLLLVGASSMIGAAMGGIGQVLSGVTALAIGTWAVLDVSRVRRG